MQVAVFSTKPYDRRFFDHANRQFGHELTYFEPRLTRQTVSLAAAFPALCAFVNDQLDAGVLLELSGGATRLLAMRCAGFNNVDLRAAARLGLRVVRVPAYSPHSVAEHTVGLMLALNRRIHKAYNRVREGNFALDGLLGFDFHGRTIGVIGTGKIGAAVARILHGFGCRLLAHDVQPNPEVVALGAEYVGLDALWPAADVITLHCPLTPETYHLIDGAAVARMKDDVMLINTSRGALVDTLAVIGGLKQGKIGYLGLDVYEEEGDLFFENLSEQVIQDDTFMRLLTFPNVLITSHQAFFTNEALETIARETLESITAFEKGEPLAREVRPAP